MRFSARLVLAVSLAGVAVSPAIVTASDTPPAEAGVITLIADSPPSIADDLDLRLMFNSAPGVFDDVTDAQCGPLATTASSPLPVRRCEGLDDGFYFIETVGGPPDEGFPTPVRCVDALGRRSSSDGDVSIDESSRETTCTVTVASPGVVIELTPQVIGNLTFPVYDIDILNDDGEVVSNDCELDERLGTASPRRWCAPLLEGTYETRPIGLPDGVEARAHCARVNSWSSRGFVPRFSLMIEDQPPFFRCSGATQLPSATLSVSLVRPLDSEPEAYETLTVTILDASGADTTANCPRSDSYFGGFSLECHGLANETHSIVFESPFYEYTLVDGCPELVVVPGGTNCANLLQATRTAPTTVPASTIAPTTTIDPLLAILPETGTPSSNTVLVALLTVVMGLGLILVSRRRPTVE